MGFISKIRNFSELALKCLRVINKLLTIERSF